MNTYEMVGLILALIIVHSLIVLFNFGALFAYFQRNRLDKCKELYKEHLIYALVWSISGILVWPGIVIATEIFRYGLKFKRLEDPKSRWWELVEDEYRRKEFRKRKNTEIPGGYCVDIWEE